MYSNNEPWNWFVPDFVVTESARPFPCRILPVAAGFDAELLHVFEARLQPEWGGEARR
jgi:hypothetical protein